MRRNITFAVWAMFAVVAVALAMRVAADEPAQARQLYIYSGTLRSLDLKARGITVDGPTGSQQFTVPTDAEIIVKGKPKGALDDLMVGDKIQVKYTDDDGVHVAHQISQLGLDVP
jgi:Cu/Ag efflux protein CusF